MDQVVLVDADDRVIGQMDKEEAHRNGGKLHRASSVMLYRIQSLDRGREKLVEVLLQRRAKTKKRWPGFWANTVCTDVRPGETYMQCAVRRLEEEMGVVVKAADLKLAFTQIYKAEYDQEYTEWEVEAVLVGEWDGEINPNEAEVGEYAWVKWAELRDWASDRNDLSPWLIKMVRDKRLELALGGVIFDHIGKFSFDVQETKNRNIENFVGVAQVPLGVAGPLTIKSSTSSQSRTSRTGRKEYWVPMATTEGALLASVNRGCKALRKAGGGVVEVERVGVTRGPVFRVKSLIEGQALEQWLHTHDATIREIAEATSGHVHYRGMTVQRMGRNVWVRFAYDTGGAMGMNMVTKATAAVVTHIEATLGVTCVALSGNGCVDKKPNWLGMIAGRGRRVRAEVVVPALVVQEVLKTTPEAVVEVVYRKQLLGSVMAGSMGFNGHYANMLAAIFLATGQDLGHIAECSVGVTTAEVVEGDLYFSVYLPDVMVGTVGGGTHLPTQHEALQLLGLGTGRDGESDELALVVGATVLAGELSLTAALAAGHLARAHEQLGRGRR